MFQSNAPGARFSSYRESTCSEDSRAALMRLYLFGALAAGVATLVLLADRSPEIAFERHTIDLGISETCAIADFNNDGRPDIFSGDAWYENPTWKRHQVRHLKEYGTYLASLTDLA